MQTGLSGWKDIPLFVIGASLLISLAFLTNKGCAHLAGSDKRQELQVQQVEALAVPIKTQLYDKFDSTPSYNKAWVTYSYETHLSAQKIFNHYKETVMKNGWICYKGCDVEVLNMRDSDPEEGVAWYKHDHFLRLFFGEQSNGILIYSIDISWRRNNIPPQAK